MTQPDPQERGGASAEVEDLDNSPAYHTWWASLPHPALGWTRQAYGYEAWRERGRRDAKIIETLQADLAQARADTDDLVAKAWDAAKAGIDQLTQECDQARATQENLLTGMETYLMEIHQLRAENQALLRVVQDVRGFIKGNALWVDVLGSLRALDGQAQPQDEVTPSS